MSTLVDGVILVVQPAKNRRRLVTRVVERLDLMKIPVLGLIINRTGLKDDRGYYGYRGYDGYEYGGGKGGHDDSAATESVAQEACVPFRKVGDRDDDEESPAMVLPRRVA